MLFGLFNTDNLITNTNYSNSNKLVERKNRKKKEIKKAKDLKQAFPKFYSILFALSKAGVPCKRVGTPINNHRYIVYRVTPINGTKPDAVKNARNSIAIQLKVSQKDIDISDVIDGLIHIKIAKKDNEISLVRFSDLKDWGSGIPLWFGVDEQLNNILFQLGELPHLMMAGITNGGKSNTLDVLICALLRHPKEKIRLILIDPKQRGMRKYEDIDSLLCPVIKGKDEAAVTKAEQAVKWLSDEIDRRYNDDDMDSERIVLVVDELLRITKQSDDFMRDIVNISTLGRECGVHMIAAAQSPKKGSLDPEFMENMPTSLCHAVKDHYAANIMRCEGAEKLRMKGDVLIARDGGKLIHCQVPLITEQEARQIISRHRAEIPEYIPELLPSAVVESVANPGYDSLGPELKQHYDACLAANATGLVAIKKLCKIGDPKARKIQAAFKKDGVLA